MSRVRVSSSARQLLWVGRAPRDTLPIVDVASSSLVIRSSTALGSRSRSARHPARSSMSRVRASSSARQLLWVGRAPRDTLPIVDVASSSLVIRSSTALGWSRSARHSAHRRCREFEPRHPLRVARRNFVPTCDEKNEATVVCPNQSPRSSSELAPKTTKTHGQSRATTAVTEPSARWFRDKRQGVFLNHRSRRERARLDSPVAVVDSGGDVTPEVSRSSP